MLYPLAMNFQRPFSDADWNNTPKSVQNYIEILEQDNVCQKEIIVQLNDQTEKLKQQAGRNSQNSNQPPSADKPFQKPARKKKTARRKRGGQKHHQGHRQTLLNPTRIHQVLPDTCHCGCHDFDDIKPFYTHQQVELPEIKLDIDHYVLHKGKCCQCGKTVSAKLDKAQSVGYGPGISALIAELSGMQANSRKSVQQFLSSVFNLPISTGAIQKVIDRVSEAIKPAYDQIAQIVRSQGVAYIDETSWFLAGKLQWLWVMATENAVFYLIHPNRSRKAFYELIGAWLGILVSDNYSVYQKWVNKRQNCLAHYIRKARSLAESSQQNLSVFGKNILEQLQLLCHFANAPPSPRQWENFYSQFLMLLILFEGADDEAGKLARSLAEQMESLWVFLDEHGVEPTNNRAERAIRYAVIWRKLCFGSQSEKGKRWTERILTLKETCRIKSLPSFPVLVELVKAYFKEQIPDLKWI